VAKIESTPVVGVETKKESTDDLCAPSFCKELAKGITPQEQTSGMPNIVAFTTEAIPPYPRCLEMNSLPKNT